MIFEDKIPLSERFLVIEGKVSKNILKQLKLEDIFFRNKNNEVLFLSYSYSDIKLEQLFDCIFDIQKPNNHEIIKCQIVKVTQQFGKIFNEIPHGWKTICQFEFENIPKMIDSLPVIETWGYNYNNLGLCKSEIYEEIKSSLLMKLTQ